jgi:hypothetical protein
MIIPAIYIEGNNNIESIRYSVNCVRESVCSSCTISKDELELVVFNESKRIVEASIEINSRRNILTEKWIASYSDNFFSLRLQRIFSIEGVYGDYRDLELLAQGISESLFKTKIYFNGLGMSLYVPDLNFTKDRLIKLDGYGVSIFWD